MTAIDVQPVERPAWVRDAIFYEIFPDRFRNGDLTNDPARTEPWGDAPSRTNFFGGDLAGIEQGLSYLADLGITALYLTPIFAAGTNHRYDTHDYLRIDPALGDTERLKSLVAAAHRLGIRVILDAVFNHCGDGFWAFQDVVNRGSSSLYRDWFTVHQWPIRQDPPSYQTCGGAPYLPKLNSLNPDLRHYLLGVARYWIEETDIDGWRLDVPWKLPTDFWEEFCSTVRSVKPDAYIVGEVWRDPQPWLHLWDGAMNYRLWDYLLDYCVRDHMDAEDFSFETGSLMTQLDGVAPWMLNLVGSHDTPRLLTVCGGDDRRAVLALTALMTLPGTPMLYYGDEIGVEGENDPDCRRCMEWDDRRWRPALMAATRRLIQLRRELLAFRCGSFTPLLCFNGTLAFQRGSGDDRVVVILNPRREQRDLAVPIEDGCSTHWTDRLGGGGYPCASGAIRVDVLPATSAMVLQSRQDS